MLFDAHTHLSNNSQLVIYNKSININEEHHFFSVGIHPWQENISEEDFKKVLKNAVHKNCLAIGEIGLDKLKGESLLKQIEIFKKQIVFSEKLKLPVIIHCVKAWEELLQIKKELNPAQKWIFHGFNKVGILNEVLQTDMLLSIGTSIFTNKKLQESIKMIPDNRLLIETDNHSVDIFEVYTQIAQIKKISLLALEEIIEQNFKRTFTKWHIG
ncbi:MAG: TatD family hydrolase [Flavobacteriia bacterium]|nr:TatD family hydrolase [Flavobacteriia bacterium]